MRKVMTRRCSPMCRKRLIEQVEKLKLDYESYYHKFVNNEILYMSPFTYEELQQEARVRGNDYDKICGLKIKVDRNIEPFTFMIREEENMDNDFLDSVRYAMGSRDNGITLANNTWFKPPKVLPKRYIINKGATILFWDDGTKNIVKRSKDDEYNKRLGFLTAYFQKHSGLTKNQANKYLANLLDEDDLNTVVGKMKARKGIN